MNNIQKGELNILEESINFFKKHNLNYFLVGGTLLGAIRHKGFIPWDDDIDIGMLRKDYEKLISVCSKNNGKINEKLQLLSYKINDTIYPFCKIVDKTIKIKGETGLDKYLWIDIFPYDFLPKSTIKTKIIYKREEILRRLLLVKYMDLNFLNKISKSRLKYFLKKLAINVFLKRLKPQTLTERMDELSVKINKKYENSEYIGCLVWGCGQAEKIFTKDIKIKELEFEGRVFNGIEGYEHYLTNLYGDYMKLPPEEERITHLFEIEE